MLDSVSLLLTPTSSYINNAAPYPARRVSHSPCQNSVGRKPSPICCASWSFAWCRSGQLLRCVCYWILHLPLTASPQSPQRRHLSRSCVSLYLFQAWMVLDGWLTYGPLALLALSSCLPSLVPRGQVTVPTSAVPMYYTLYTVCFASLWWQMTFWR